LLDSPQDGSTAGFRFTYNHRKQVPILRQLFNQQTYVKTLKIMSFMGNHRFNEKQQKNSLKI
ncbi:hypothetical protein ACFWQ8_30215, partial [Streptomyces albidoflavus]